MAGNGLADFIVMPGAQSVDGGEWRRDDLVSRQSLPKDGYRDIGFIMVDASQKTNRDAERTVCRPEF
jgi:hypothetical protein